jgi:hypothetical protein
MKIGKAQNPLPVKVDEKKKIRLNWSTNKLEGKREETWTRKLFARCKRGWKATGTKYKKY